MSQYIFDTSVETFDQDVIELSQEKPVLVDFWADWCTPCLIIAPVLSSVVDEYDGEVVLAKLEVDEGENMRLAGKYKVRGFPTIMMLYKGEELARFSSAKPAHWIREWIDQQMENTELNSLES